MMRRDCFFFVTPAQAGVQGSNSALALDSRFRGNDAGINAGMMPEQIGRSSWN